MRPVPHLRLRSIVPVSVVLLAVALGATACGESDGDDDSARGDSSSDTRDDADASSDDPSDTADAAPVTLSAEQVEQATITLANLGEGWAEEEVDGDESDDPGCFRVVDGVIDNFEPAAETKKEFGYGDQALPHLDATVSSYDSGALAVQLFDEVEELLETCQSVNETDADGYLWDLTVAPQTDLDLDDIAIDDQFTFVASGTLEIQGQTVPVSLHWTAVRSGPTILTTSTSSTEDVGDLHVEIAKVAAHRLAAVVAGEEPEATVVPAP